MSDVVKKLPMFQWLRNGRLDPMSIIFFMSETKGWKISRMKALELRSRLEMGDDGWRYRKEDMIFLEKSPFEGEFASLKGYQPMPFLRRLVGQWTLNMVGDDRFKSPLEAWSFLVEKYVEASIIFDEVEGHQIEKDIKKSLNLELAGGLTSYFLLSDMMES